MSGSYWRNPSARFVRVVKVLCFGLSLWPLAGLIGDGLTGGLGANPVEKITRTTGWWTLAFLMMTLTVTPLRKISGWPWLGRFRRMLGLFAFFYACLHFMTYLVFDQFFDWSAIAVDIGKRAYITVGFSAFVLLIPLAATSTDGMIRRLGGRSWRRLHRLVYAIAVAGVFHFGWLVKKDITEPLAFALILAVLLSFRLLDGLDKGWLRRRVAKCRLFAGSDATVRETP